MKYRNADHAVTAYLKVLRESQRRGFNPKGIEGHVYAATCPHCGGRKWKRDERGTQRCQGFRCGRSRPASAVFIPKSYFHQRRRKSRTGESLHTQREALSSMDAFAELGWVLDRLKLWHGRALVVYLIAGSYEAAVEFMRTRFTYREGGWTLYTVRKLVREARQAVEEELGKRGMLQ